MTPDPLAEEAALARGGSELSAGRLLLRVGFHTVLLVAMPFIVGGVTGFFAEVSQVSETLDALVRFSATLLLPVLVIQLVAISVKVSRERKALAVDGPLPPLATLRALDRHVRVLTDKGLGMFFGALLALVLALGFKFAELGIIAVLGLSLLYVVSAMGILMSTFVVARFEERLATRGGTIGREFIPVVVESGESVEESFHLERVPVPPGFTLRIHQQLPARLATESRHVVGADVSMQRVTVTRALRRTPRGDWRIGPADVVYSDLFGLTRVSVAQAASARLKVLPRLYPVVVAEAPRSYAKEEGSLTILRKMPTEDWFRFRDYLPGDDTRRIQWKLSVKLGRLQVRLPETVPVARRKVRLVLDNFVPAGWAVGEEAELVIGDALDRLVELWLSLARALSERGEEVLLVLPTGDPMAPFDEHPCKRGMQSRLRELGARVRWQSLTDFTHAGALLEKDQSMTVVTARFVPLPGLPPPMGATLTWVFLPIADALPGPVPGVEHATLKGAFMNHFDAGAEENATFLSFRRAKLRRRLETLRQSMERYTTEGSALVEATLRARGEPFYKVRRSGAAYMLEG